MSKQTFVDFRAVKASVSMEKILGHYGLLETLHGAGETRRGPCPIHNGSNKNQFSVNLTKNVWNCFSECKCGGNVLDFVSKREGVDIHKAALLLCEWFALKLESDERTEESVQAQSPKAKTRQKSTERPTEEDQTPNKPLGFELKDLDPNHPYLTTRGTTPELAKEFGIGFFPGTKGLMVGRIAIPVHNEAGKLVAYAGRFPGEPPNDEVPRYKLPPGFKKSLEVYNLHRIATAPQDQPLVLVEGFFDCIHLWQCGARRVVALMGSTLSTEQEDLILKHTSEETAIVIALDEDDAGRASRGEIAARLALHRFVRTQRFDKENQQPSELTSEAVQMILRQCRGFSKGAAA